MKDISLMIKPASSLCNMRCCYCFYADVSSLRTVQNYGMMSHETVKKMLEHVFFDLEDGDKITFCFQGGEPTLAGIAFFQMFVDEVQIRKKGVLVRYTLQTNGTLLNELWCKFFKEHCFLIGLSLDAMAGNHNKNRVTASGEETFKTVLAAKKLLEAHHVEYNILTVLTEQLARHPRQAWSFLEKERIRYIQFIPCLSSLHSEAAAPCSLTPKQFATFYTDLFQIWYREFLKNNYISIKLFDDVLSLLSAGQQNACGMMGRCLPQIVVEADGSTYPCDFYVLDEFCTGNLTQMTLRQIYEHPNMRKFREAYQEKSAHCESCRFSGICGGGCKRMRREVYCAPGMDSCGYEEFLNACIGELQQLARWLRK